MTDVTPECWVVCFVSKPEMVVDDTKSWRCAYASLIAYHDAHMTIPYDGVPRLWLNYDNPVFDLETPEHRQDKPHARLRLSM